MLQSTYHFNREVLLGECGALVLANASAPIVYHFTRSPTVISSAAVAATLIGGALGWLGARIYDRVRDRTFTAKVLASDIGYFTPAAIILGFAVYDPSIYLASHYLLIHGAGDGASVFLGQLLAFVLFLAALNAYRLLLIRFRGKSL
jgi:hypothetical protein